MHDGDPRSPWFWAGNTPILTVETRLAELLPTYKACHAIEGRLRGAPGAAAFPTIFNPLRGLGAAHRSGDKTAWWWQLGVEP
jgi:hypothetical protein